ncbi:hypothetical protein Ancab_015363 [Ancistrocladus abbreviatus]
MVKGEHQAFPLAPSNTHRRRYEEFAISNFNFHDGKTQLRSSRSSKCFVCLLATFVLLFLILLIFSLIVLQVRTPSLLLSSVSLKTLSYDYSPSINITMQVKIAIKNNNFGNLELDKSSRLSILYRNSTIGDNNNNNAEFVKRRIGAKKEDELGIWGRLNGKVNLLKKIRRTAAEMHCSVTIDLRIQVTQKLLCC